MNILIIEDEKDVANLLALYLANEEYTVKTAFTLGEGKAMILENPPDLLLLDVMLPDGDGFEFLSNLRKEHEFPVIMMTARDSEGDKIQGLTFGADDYITKPFRPLEVVARVKAQLRRYFRYGGGSPSNELSVKALRLTPNARTAFLGDKELALTPTEYDILLVLLESKGQVVTTEELFKGIWKDEYYSKESNTIPVHIRHLREKIGDKSDKPTYIKTVWGVGYKIEK